MEDYPILIRGSTVKLVKVKARNFRIAIELALMKYRNQFVNYKYAKNMDLISAKKEAMDKSKKSAHKQFVTLVDGGEFEVENYISLPKDADVYATFHKGKEIKNEPVAAKVDAATKVTEAPAKEVTKTSTAKINVKQQKEEIMKTAKKTAKVENKKAVDKKAAEPKKAVKEVKEVAPKGATVHMTVKEVIKKMEDGKIFYTRTEALFRKAILVASPNKDRVMYFKKYEDGLQQVK